MTITRSALTIICCGVGSCGRPVSCGAPTDSDCGSMAPAFALPALSWRQVSCVRCFSPSELAVGHHGLAISSLQAIIAPEVSAS